MEREIPNEGQQVVGRITIAPEQASKDGNTFCRMLVATGPIGGTELPPVAAVYVGGELAERCGRGLDEGYLISAIGRFHRGRRKARFPEMIADDIKLWDKGGRPGARS